jgi:hypothetical protein
MTIHDLMGERDVSDFEGLWQEDAWNASQWGKKEKQNNDIHFHV